MNVDKLKHTPGPWYPKNTAGDHQGLAIAENTGVTVALTYSVNDAALVAAAPDLLAALMMAQKVLHPGVVGLIGNNHGAGYCVAASDAVYAIRAAIAKARGE